MKIKSFCLLDNNVKFMNKQATDTGKFFAKQTHLIKYFYQEYIKNSHRSIIRKPKYQYNFLLKI